MYDIEGIDLASPKSVFRSCRENKLLSDEETIDALTMANDRNLTVRTYNEAVAEKTHSKLKLYYSILSQLVERMRNRLSKGQ
ncbi:nucleotidyltransferase substrate binding protein [Halobacillus amylolyticus]|uniref:nucleotidyltransferase substrate binding protein n=1 Tax=Halobacillus amylolyticus TaxID=2932259 RepID=UPI0037C03BA0